MKKSLLVLKHHKSQIIFGHCQNAILEITTNEINAVDFPIHPQTNWAGLPAQSNPLPVEALKFATNFKARKKKNLLRTKLTSNKLFQEGCCFFPQLKDCKPKSEQDKFFTNFPPKQKIEQRKRVPNGDRISVQGSDSCDFVENVEMVAIRESFAHFPLD